MTALSDLTYAALLPNDCYWFLMEIRSPTPLELPECETVLLAAFAPFALRLGRELSDDAFSGLQSEDPERYMLVAVDNTVIRGVAICTARKNTWTIDQVAVAPGNQGKGIGSALIQRIERDAISEGAGELELDTAEIMTDLLRLYGRLGFTTIRKGPPKHGRDRFTRVFMQKPI